MDGDAMAPILYPIVQQVVRTSLLRCQNLSTMPLAQNSTNRTQSSRLCTSANCLSQVRRDERVCVAGAALSCISASACVHTSSARASRMTRRRCARAPAPPRVRQDGRTRRPLLSEVTEKGPGCAMRWVSSYSCSRGSVSARYAAAAKRSDGGTQNGCGCPVDETSRSEQKRDCTGAR
eukprot:6204275-Pleurochrysis_carterae.AAC.1